MNPQLHCPQCGYTRSLDVRGLLARMTMCPRCPDSPRMLLRNASEAPARGPEDPGPASR